MEFEGGLTRAEAEAAELVPGHTLSILAND